MLLLKDLLFRKYHHHIGTFNTTLPIKAFIYDETFSYRLARRYRCS